MKNHLDTVEPIDDVEPVPGPLYPDRCLECPELLNDTYGGVRHSRCADCVSAALRRDRRRAEDEPEGSTH